MSPGVGQRIRGAREARGISLRKLAERIGIHYSHLSKVENGKDTIGRNSLLRIAEELGEDADLLLGEAGRQAMPFRVVGDIAAGVPIEAIEDVETFDLSKQFDPGDHFLLRVRGNSMVNDGINDGDLAIVRHANVAENGDTVAAIVDGAATLKRFRMWRNKIVLIPANSHMQEQKYSAAQVEIRGVLVGIIRTAVK